MRTQQAIARRQRRGAGRPPTMRTRAPRGPATNLMVALATITVALLTATSAAASTDQTVSPRDNCGGFNGHVVVSDGSTPTLQLYGEVWDNACPGSTSVWLAWQSPGYHNIQIQAADESATDGVNYTTVPLQLVPADIKVTVCSTYGGWHCGTAVSLPDASGGTDPRRRSGGGGGRWVDRRLGDAHHCPAPPPQATIAPVAKRFRAQAGPRRRGLLGAERRLWLARSVRPQRRLRRRLHRLRLPGARNRRWRPETVLNDRSTSNDHYWYFSTFRYGRWWSHSWSVAEDLAVHLNLLHSTWLRYWRDARPGDVIFVDWTSSSFAGIDHVGIVTGMKGGEPLITQHTPSQRGVTLHYWQTHPPHSSTVARTCTSGSPCPIRTEVWAPGARAASREPLSVPGVLEGVTAGVAVLSWVEKLSSSTKPDSDRRHGHHQELARLVPIDLVVHVEDDVIRLNCTKQHFEELDAAEDIQFLPSDPIATGVRHTRLRVAVLRLGHAAHVWGANRSRYRSGPPVAWAARHGLNSPKTRSKRCHRCASALAIDLRARRLSVLTPRRLIRRRELRAG